MSLLVTRLRRTWRLNALTSAYAYPQKITGGGGVKRGIRSFFKLYVWMEFKRHQLSSLEKHKNESVLQVLIANEWCWAQWGGPQTVQGLCGHKEHSLWDHFNSFHKLLVILYFNAPRAFLHTKYGTFSSQLISSLSIWVEWDSVPKWTFPEWHTLMVQMHFIIFY